MTVSSFLMTEPPSIQSKDERTSFLKTLARHKMKACLHSKKQTQDLSAKHTQTPGLQEDSLLGRGAYQVCQQSHKKTLTSPAIENSRIYTNGHLNYGEKRWVINCHLNHLRSPGDAVWGLAGSRTAAWNVAFHICVRSHEESAMTSPHCSSIAATAKHFSFSSRRCLAVYYHIRGSAGPKQEAWDLPLLHINWRTGLKLLFHHICHTQSTKTKSSHEIHHGKSIS